MASHHPEAADAAAAAAAVALGVAKEVDDGSVVEKEPPLERPTEGREEGKEVGQEDEEEDELFTIFIGDDKTDEVRKQCVLSISRNREYPCCCVLCIE